MSASIASPAMPVSIPLESFGFLQLEGARATEFLQGQLTCDLRQASATHFISGAWCTPKGRVICSMALWQQAADRVILRMSADLLQATAAQLSKYAALSRVRIVPGELRCVGVLGLVDAGTRSRLALPWPDQAGEVRVFGDGAVLRLDAAGERHELWVTEDASAKVLQRLREVLPEGSGNDWRLALVRAGIAEIRSATCELFLPQMLGYDSDGRVSFRKGCYTGQEIVARTHYKGGVKRHLHRLEGCGEPPAPGTALEFRGQSAGTVVESAVSGEGTCDVLAVLADDLAADAAGTPFVAAGTEFHLPA